MSIIVTETSFVEFPDRGGILGALRAIEVYDSAMEPMFRMVADRLDSRAYDRSAFVFILLELIYELETDSITFSDLLGRVVFALTADLDLVGEALEAFEEIQETLSPGRSSNAASSPAVSPESDVSQESGEEKAGVAGPDPAPAQIPPTGAEAARPPGQGPGGNGTGSSPPPAAEVLVNDVTDVTDVETAEVEVEDLETGPEPREGPESAVAVPEPAQDADRASPGGRVPTASRKLDASSRIWAREADREHLMLELQGTQKRVLDFGLATRVSIEMALARPSRGNVKQTLRDITELRKNLLRFEELLRESEEKILEAIGILD